VGALLDLVKHCRWHIDFNNARDLHYAAHPADRDADVVIFGFYDDGEMADEGEDCFSPGRGPLVQWRRCLGVNRARAIC